MRSKLQLLKLRNYKIKYFKPCLLTKGQFFNSQINLSQSSFLGIKATSHHVKVTPFSPVPLEIFSSATKISIKNKLNKLTAYLKDINLKLNTFEGFKKKLSFYRVNRGKTKFQKVAIF